MTQDVVSVTEPFPNGGMRLFGLFGDPVAQVRTPFPVTEMMRAAGSNAALLPMHVTPASLARVFGALREIRNFDGLVVTVPHKIAMAELVDDLTERARLAGAINLARRERDGRWRGDIVDGLAFVRGLARSGFTPRGRPALLVGTGGAGSAVAAELARAGAVLRIYDISRPRADVLAERLRRGGFTDVAVLDEPDPTGAALVVNATPLGMKPDDPLPVDPARLDPSMLVAEVVMKPPVTALLEAAQRRGCRIQLGEEVMLNQLDAMIGFLLDGRVADEADVPTKVIA
ncbi:MAG: shikimate dehydrogenase [Pseudomonadota bacterium]|jgi:shikimate dehydrogenase